MSSNLQLALNLESECAYAREDFFRGSSNTHAFRAVVEAWPHWNACGQVLVGPSGSGKTHLARIWQALSQATFLNAEDCLRKGQKHIVNAQGPAIFILEGFPNHFQEQEVFHLYNLVKEEQGALLILSQTLPQEWSLALPDLRSRLFSLPLQRLGDPDDEVLRAVLRKRFSDFQMKVPENVVSYALSRMERSFRAAQDFSRKLNLETLMRKKKVSLSLARACLEGLYTQ